jgi:hypothetical protein
LGKDAVVTDRDPVELAAMVKVRLTDWVCAGLPESITENVSAVALAAAVGVPLISPVAGFKLKPVGSAPDVSDQV